jgi:hypothetical protein
MAPAATTMPQWVAVEVLSAAGRAGHAGMVPCHVSRRGLGGVGGGCGGGNPGGGGGATERTRESLSPGNTLFSSSLIRLQRIYNF